METELPLVLRLCELGGLFCKFGSLSHVSSSSRTSFSKRSRRLSSPPVWLPCSEMLSSNLVMVSRLLILALSMASNFSKTASILDTMLPILCSTRSTLLVKLFEKKKETKNSQILLKNIIISTTVTTTASSQFKTKTKRADNATMTLKLKTQNKKCYTS